MRSFRYPTSFSPGDTLPKQRNKPRVSSTGRLQRTGTLFLEEGRIEIDGNAVERTIRPIALQRKNALFAGHDTGAQHWAVIASLIETCSLNKTEPHSYLTDVLTAIVNGHKRKDIDQLLPWNWVG